jgi:hypothetical protein
MPQKRLLIALVAGCLLIGTVGQCWAAKKLIQFSGAARTPAYVKEHYQEMDKLPFDGTVFLLGRGGDRPHAGKPWDNLSWACWGHRYFDWDDVKHHADELKAAKFTRLTDNFLMMTVVPGDVDWFDDFGPVVHNYKLAARIAKQGNCKGILFDSEVYGTHQYSSMWDYDSNYGRVRFSDVYTYDEYAAQARKRGREIMNAMQEEYPGLTVFITHSYTHVWLNWMRDPTRVKEPAWCYTLLTPFLDGFHDAAKDPTKIVDGRENAYRYKTKAEYDQAYTEGSEEILRMVADPEKYKKVRSLGFGLYMDAPVSPGAYGSWMPNDPKTWWFTPAEWEQTLKYALERSDEYVWIYSEKPGWWEDWKKDMPQELYDATVRAYQWKEGK